MSSPMALRFGCPKTTRCLPRSISVQTSAIKFFHSPCRCAALVSCDIARAGEPDDLARYRMRELQARNVASSSGDPALLEVAALRTRFLLRATPLTPMPAYRSPTSSNAGRQAGGAGRQLHSDRDAYADGELDWPRLTSELLGLFHQRGEALGGRVVGDRRGGAAEFGDFLMLQAINRYEPLLAHYADSGALHPEDLFQFCASAAGELSTFTTTSKRPPKFPGYRHDRLAGILRAGDRCAPRFAEQVLTEIAIPIPLEPRRFGISRGDRDRPDAVQHGRVHPCRPCRRCLRKSCGGASRAQLKIGPAEKIGDLVTSGLRGVPVHPVPVAPRQIPYHAGFAYFELDQTDELWGQLKNSGGVAVHVAGDFPGLTMEFWAIRS